MIHQLNEWLSKVESFVMFNDELSKVKSFVIFVGNTTSKILSSSNAQPELRRQAGKAGKPRKSTAKLAIIGESKQEEFQVTG